MNVIYLIIILNKIKFAEGKPEILRSFPFVQLKLLTK